MSGHESLFLDAQDEAMEDWAYGDGHIWAGWSPSAPALHDACGCEICSKRLLAAKALCAARASSACGSAQPDSGFGVVR